MFRILGVLIFSLAMVSHAGIRAGYWKETLTPTHEEALASCLGGYGSPYSRCGITDIHNEISVRSLAITDQDSQLVFAVIDTIGVGDSVIADIQNRASLQSLGEIQPQNILVTAIHTHSGPDLQGLWGGISAEYKERIIRTTVRSILNAYHTKKAATLHAWTAQGDIENRRGWDIVDTDITALEFRSKKYGRSIATLINMSAHPTIIDEMGLTYSSDYVGSLRETVEQQANTSVVFINGIVGDAQPAGEGTRTTATADYFGKLMAERILAMSSAAESIKGQLHVEQYPIRHPVENPGLLGAVQAGLLDVFLTPDLQVETQIGLFKIGKKVTGIIFPGEALSRMGMPIKDQLPGEYDLFFGLSGDSLGYFIPSDEFLQIPGRTTEEVASVSPTVGDHAAQVLTQAIDDFPWKKHPKHCRD